jgi:CheY-like chemotaxis protein
MNEETVLVVEDNESYRELLVIALENEANVRHVKAYATGTAAVAAVEATAPELWPFMVVLDFHMPEMSGLTVLRRLNDLGYSGRCAVISNAATASDRAACEAAGAVFLYKPARYDDLIAALNALVGRPDAAGSART